MLHMTDRFLLRGAAGFTISALEGSIQMLLLSFSVGTD